VSQHQAMAAGGRRRGPEDAAVATSLVLTAEQRTPSRSVARFTSGGSRLANDQMCTESKQHVGPVFSLDG